MNIWDKFRLVGDIMHDGVIYAGFRDSIRLGLPEVKVLIKVLRNCPYWQWSPGWLSRYSCAPWKDIINTTLKELYLELQEFFLVGVGLVRCSIFSLRMKSEQLMKQCFKLSSLTGLNEDHKVVYCHKLLTKLDSILDAVSCLGNPLVGIWAWLCHWGWTQECQDLIVP